MEGIVYVWMGNRCNSEEARLAEEIASEMFGVSSLFKHILFKRNGFGGLECHRMLKWLISHPPFHLTGLVVVNVLCYLYIS